MTTDDLLVPLGAIEHKFVNDDFLADSNDRFITYTPDLNSLDSIDKDMLEDCKKNPDKWYD